jgi:hypothetical protein
MCQPQPKQPEDLPEWTGSDLPDDAVIVRGGIMAHESLTISAKRHFQEHGVYALSFWSYPGMDACEIAEEVGRVAEAHGITLLPNPQIRQSTAGALRGLGYRVGPGGGLRGHITLALDSLPDETEWAEFVAVFREAEINPIAQ